MRHMTILVLLACVPAFAQRGSLTFDDDDDAGRREVYALIGYSNTWEPSYPGYFSPGTAAPRRHWNGANFGAGYGGYAGLLGLQVEGFQIRNSSSSRWPCLNTGVANLVIEKRTGRIRPGGILLGIGGATDGQSDFLFLQFGASVALYLNGKLFVRPQVRFQGWVNGMFGPGAPTVVTAGVAVGYRF